MCDDYTTCCDNADNRCDERGWQLTDGGHDTENVATECIKYKNI